MVAVEPCAWRYVTGGGIMKLFLPAIACMCVMLMLNGCALVTMPLQMKTMPFEEQVLEGEGRPKILILDVHGIITEKEKEGGFLAKGAPSVVSHVRETLMMAERDDDVAGIIVRINSPGGTVTASDTIHHDLLSFKSRRRIPVYACITGIGTSGGYYIATATDEIFAHPTAITGSIGVLLMKFNVEGLLTKIGVSEQTVKSGDKKDILSPFRPATAEERQLVQTIIDRLHARFVDVALARPKNTLSRERMEALADGRIFMADQALEAKLIDRSGYLDDAVADMKKALGVENARIITYYRPGSYKGSIYAESAASSIFPDDLSLLFGGSVGLTGAGGFMYLWMP
jgi:protease IV